VRIWPPSWGVTVLSFTVNVTAVPPASPYKPNANKTIPTMINTIPISSAIVLKNLIFSLQLHCFPHLSKTGAPVFKVRARYVL
jgi:hypothetical protein